MYNWGVYGCLGVWGGWVGLGWVGLPSLGLFLSFRSASILPGSSCPSLHKHRSLRAFKTCNAHINTQGHKTVRSSNNLHRVLCGRGKTKPVQNMRRPLNHKQSRFDLSDTRTRNTTSVVSNNMHRALRHVLK